MTYEALLKLLDGFNPAQLDAQVEINVRGTHFFPNETDFVYPYPVAE